MSGQTSIDKIALDFIAVYKRVKDKRSGPVGEKKEGEGLRRNPGRKQRLDKHPC
ncbi:MAG: hypothetical protein ACM3UT_09720 [Chloroflexota bacterium]